MTDFPKSSAALNAAVAAATTSEEIRELVKSAMESDGTISRERGFETNITVHRMPEMATPEVSMPAQHGKPKCYRVVYPMGNARIEIAGMSEADLDAQEEDSSAVPSVKETDLVRATISKEASP